MAATGVERRIVHSHHSIILDLTSNSIACLSFTCNSLFMRKSVASGAIYISVPGFCFCFRFWFHASFKNVYASWLVCCQLGRMYYGV